MNTSYTLMYEWIQETLFIIKTYQQHNAPESDARSFLSSFYHSQDGAAFQKHLTLALPQPDLLQEDDGIAYILRFSKVYDCLGDEASKTRLLWLLRFRICWMLTGSLVAAQKMCPYPMECKINYAKALMLQKRHVHDGTEWNDGIYRVSANRHELFLTWCAETYIYPGKTVFHENNVIIDAGAYQGETAVWYAKMINRKGKIYAIDVYEPHIENIYQNASENHLEAVITPVYRGLWHEHTIGGIAKHGEDTNSMYCSTEATLISVPFISLDQLVAELSISRIDHIKMDIEGSEVNALTGATKTIRRYRPQLSVAAYHSFFAMFTIIEMILGMDQRYEVYIAHKLPMPFDTTIFAIP